MSRIQTEPLGTLASPTQPTSYVYDVLDDLTGVTQGSQTRSFTYDSLKRLKQAVNPESGTINYTYDANSNLFTKQDARLMTTTYFYDTLNRVTKRTYTDSTPEVDYYYDNQALPTTKPPNFAPTFSTGRLIAMCYGGVSSSAGSYQSYDQLGRVTSSYQQTDSINYGFGYGYNLASEMTSETYPSGRQVITEYDSAGRAAGIRAAAIYYAGATASDSTNRIQYAPQGAVSTMKLGNGKWEHTNFNNRLQPTQIGLGTSGTDSSLLKLDYEYTSSCQTGNNGNVMKQTINASGLILTQNYCYDSLNRLSSASENSGSNWTQTYGFDRYGNRWMSGYIVPGNESRTPQNVNAFNQGNNRIQLSGFDYDFAGNLKNDPTTPANAILYDAENRQVSFTKSGTTTYSYDGDGHRVKKVTGSVTTVFVYNAVGQLSAEYTNTSEATPPVGGGGTSYLTSDHLGSTRVVTKTDGSVKARYDYLPFGEEIPSTIGARGGVTGYGGADSTKQKFTQKERDNESGLDYFGARYYSGAQGRFTTADPLDPVLGKQGAEDKEKAAKAFFMYLSQPQHWNRYGYVLNNPMHYADPDGLNEVIVVGLNIVFDKNSNYTDKEKAEIRRRYVEEANKLFKPLDITFAVVSESTGAATNLDNKNRSIEGYSTNNVNVFFTKNDSLPSTEVTRYGQGSIFIQTHTPNSFFSGESPTDSDLAAHGAMHAFGVATGQNGYPNNRFGTLWAENDVTNAMYKLEHNFVVHPYNYNYGDPQSNRVAFLNSSTANILREGARKYAIGGKAQ